MSVRASDLWLKDVKAMSLVGMAHGTSHFFQLVLATLAPVYFVPHFQVGYAEVGALMTVFYVTSGLGQPVAGFLVDRLGARRILLGGLAIYVSGIFMVALAPSFWLLFPIIVFTALGNCIFHPSDFTILNASVSPDRLGRAYSVHTLGGNLGWALAPASMLTIATLTDWRIAAASAGCVGLAVLAVLAVNRDQLKEERGQSATPGTAPKLGMEVLFSAPVLSCFAYFVLLAAALIAVQNYLPATLKAVHATPLALAGTALTGFLLGSSAGVVAGGVVADRFRRQSLVIALGLAGSALMFVLVGELDLPAVTLIGSLALAGFLQGVTTPSRDMLVRSATPPGATGRVFGFVYSGLDVGSAFSPVAVGLIIDQGEAHWIFWLVAAALALAIVTAFTIGPARRLQPQPAE